ncbi:hypothetical protein CONPUDRAFT_89505 [Coniophora puteana RWD-64-598 SS2]|uniref:Uncharacterized protein n=1 Tax=Coniophora puteana (strain RWD-64-598) TaxID=741705 RepID=A0A5M3MSM0_CONPW|nr:uncharacterized protein CONPUDRAFT_89505 [Coniophora puteana RWD-64-598 SS2]EIW82027.1 hypothetical protein CONPUDRAFT_89505 [Coniophora puteana RWD-64-598 SS2]
MSMPNSRVEFEFTFKHYVNTESSAAKIRSLLDFWNAVLAPYGATAPWRNKQDLYKTIDAIPNGGIPWKVYKGQYGGPLPPSPPKWMMETYKLCTRDTRSVLHQQLATADFKNSIHYIPYRHFNKKGQRVFSNLMSGEWAWRQADMLAEDPCNHSAAFIPVIAGSDKTTISVATGHQEFHPVYMSAGNLSNMVRRGHSNSVLPIVFLPIPRTKQRHRNKPEFCTFCRQLYHEALRQVFQPLAAGMETPEVARCPDGHFRQVIYGLGPYITNYPKQVWLSDALWDEHGICGDYRSFTHHFPRADIHKLLSPDLLHQVIKGTFKDHVILWIPRWTGDDSKALMKFCYIACQNSLSTEDLNNLDHTLTRFHRLREIFIHVGVCPTGISLPHQHSLCHYRHSIVLFGSPNGLWSAITESKHIVAVKKPWQWSNHFKALYQMLCILVRLDNLEAARRAFKVRGMMAGMTSSYRHVILGGNIPSSPDNQSAAPEDLEDDHVPLTGPKVLSSIELSCTREQARIYPCNPCHLAAIIGQPRLLQLIRQFLFSQMHPDHNPVAHPVAIEDCPVAPGPVFVHHSAITRFWAPSNYLYLFFSLQYDDILYPCALIHWFVTIGNCPDPTTGMWIVCPEYLGNQPNMAVVHLDSISRAVHLMLVYGTGTLPEAYNFMIC